VPGGAARGRDAPPVQGVGDLTEGFRPCASCRLDRWKHKVGAGVGAGGAGGVPGFAELDRIGIPKAGATSLSGGEGGAGAIRNDVAFLLGQSGIGPSLAGFNRVLERRIHQRVSEGDCRA